VFNSFDPRELIEQNSEDDDIYLQEFNLKKEEIFAENQKENLQSKTEKSDKK
jgi:hypothetical protein